VEGVVVDQVFSVVRYVDCRSVPETFAIKVESCQKSHRNLDVLWPSYIFGGGPSKNCTQIITPTSRHVVSKSLMRMLPLASPEVIGVHMPNFRANFKFLQLNFLGAVPAGVCANKPWPISSAFKNMRASTPLGAKM